MTGSLINRKGNSSKVRSFEGEGVEVVKKKLMGGREEDLINNNKILPVGCDWELMGRERRDSINKKKSCKVRSWKNIWPAGWVCLLVLMIGLFVVLMVGAVDGLGITPARASVDFAAGAEKTISFSVVNTDGKDMNLVVFADGELNQSIFILESMLTMSAGESEKQISYSVRMPDSLSPGVHSADIVVLEVPESGGGIGAVVGVIAKLNVYVPYPGKYAEAEMYVTGSEQGGDVKFVIPVVSRGEIDLVSVKANIDIYNSMGERVDSFNTVDVSANKESRGEIVHSWAADVPVGVYLARATFIYDGETAPLEKQFNIGEMVLDLQQIEVRDFKLGEIAKFEMLVENKWGEEVGGVYTLMSVFNTEGDVMAEFKSPTETIPGFEKKVLTSYWDTGGVKRGTYDSAVSLIYGGKSVDKGLQLKVSDDMIEIIGFGYVISTKKLLDNRDLLIKVLVGGIVILVVINIAWFVFLRKRLFGRRRKVKKGFVISSGRKKRRVKTIFVCILLLVLGVFLLGRFGIVGYSVNDYGNVKVGYSIFEDENKTIVVFNFSDLFDKLRGFWGKESAEADYSPAGACELTRAYFSKEEINDGEMVRLVVEGVGCDGKDADFLVKEKGLFGEKKVARRIAVFENGQAVADWRVFWHDVNPLPFVEENPRYSFNVEVNPSINSENLLVVFMGLFSPEECGDDIDNDEDGYIDIDDIDCSVGGAENPDTTYDPTGSEEGTVGNMSCNPLPDSGNLIYNGNLECDLDEDGVPDGWNKFEDEDHISLWVEDPFGVYDGKVFIAEATDFSYFSPWRYYYPDSYYVAVEPNTWYEFSASFAAENVLPQINEVGEISMQFSMGMQIIQYNKSLGWVSEKPYIGLSHINLTDWDEGAWVFRTYNTTGFEDWRSPTVYFKTFNATRYITLSTRLWLQGSMSYDDFVLRKVDNNGRNEDPSLPPFKRSGLLHFTTFDFGKDGNEEDFFPIIFQGGLTNESGQRELNFSRLKAERFNTVAFSATQGDTPLLSQHNVSGILGINQLTTGDWNENVGEAEVKKWRNDPNSEIDYYKGEQMRGWIDLVSGFDDETLIFWDLFDEVPSHPNRDGMYTPDLGGYKAVCDYIREKTPKAYITTNLNSVYTGLFEDLNYYANYTDINTFTLNTGPAYPSDEGSIQLTSGGERVRKMLELMSEQGRPDYLVFGMGLGIWEWSKWDGVGTPYIPFNLQRFQIWHQIINGATGIWFYTSINLQLIYDSYHFEQIKVLGNELGVLYDVLLEEKFYDEWSVSDDRIEIMMKKHNDKIYLFSVNTHYEDLDDVTIELDDYDIVSVKALNENDAGDISIGNNRSIESVSLHSFIDDFNEQHAVGLNNDPDAPGYAVHIYEVEHSAGGDGGGDGGGGGGGRALGGECYPEWNCGSWGMCVEGIQKRTCEDFNRCDVEIDVPVDERECGTTLDERQMARKEKLDEMTPEVVSLYNRNIIILVVLFAGVIILVVINFLILRKRKMQNYEKVNLARTYYGG